MLLNNIAKKVKKSLIKTCMLLMKPWSIWSKLIIQEKNGWICQILKDYKNKNLLRLVINNKTNFTMKFSHRLLIGKVMIFQLVNLLQVVSWLLKVQPLMKKDKLLSVCQYGNQMIVHNVIIVVLSVLMPQLDLSC